MSKNNKNTKKTDKKHDNKNKKRMELGLPRIIHSDRDLTEEEREERAKIYAAYMDCWPR